MPDGPESEPLGYLLYRVAAALRGDLTATVLEPLGLTFPQYLCMRMLYRTPGRSNADLARETGVSPQAMNMVLRSLQERGSVHRPATVNSGRSLPAELSSQGRAELARIDAGVQATEQRLTDGLTDAQKRMFREILVTLGSD